MSPTVDPCVPVSVSGQQEVTTCEREESEKEKVNY